MNLFGWEFHRFRCKRPKLQVMCLLFIAAFLNHIYAFYISYNLKRVPLQDLLKIRGGGGGGFC